MRVYVGLVHVRALHLVPLNKRDWLDIHSALHFDRHVFCQGGYMILMHSVTVVVPQAAAATLPCMHNPQAPCVSAAVPNC